MPLTWTSGVSKAIWEFPQIRGTFKRIFSGPLKGIYKGSVKGLGFRVSENYGDLIWSPYNKDPTI